MRAFLCRLFFGWMMGHLCRLARTIVDQGCLTFSVTHASVICNMNVQFVNVNTPTSLVALLHLGAKYRSKMSYRQLHINNNLEVKTNKLEKKQHPVLNMWCRNDVFLLTRKDDSYIPS